MLTALARASPLVLMAAAPSPSPIELARNRGLEAALSSDGSLITIAGYASLMDAASAAETTPSLSNFRFGRVEGYCRIFSLVSIINIRKGLADGVRLTTATARPREGSHLSVCLYEVPLNELSDLLQRERRLRASCVPYDGGSALMFIEYSHDEYFHGVCGSDEAVYHEEVGQYYDGDSIYRTDLLPVDSYVLRCVRAHAVAGPESLANLLDHSYLGDGATTLREYLRHELSSFAREYPRHEKDDYQKLGMASLTQFQRAELRAALEV